MSSAKNIRREVADSELMVSELPIQGLLVPFISSIYKILNSAFQWSSSHYLHIDPAQTKIVRARGHPFNFPCSSDGFISLHIKSKDQSSFQRIANIQFSISHPFSLFARVLAESLEVDQFISGIRIKLSALLSSPDNRASEASQRV